MKKALKMTAINSFAIYVLLLIYILFINFRAHFGEELSLADYIKYCSNLMPFRSIVLYIEALFTGSMNIETPIQNLFGNLLIFLPMGLYLPYFFKRLQRFQRYAICMAAVLIGVEAIQILLRVGSFDIDDVILNIAGACAGFAVFKLAQKIVIKKAANTQANKAALSE